ncbi:hypothetical protein HS088_TW13G00591 [Tripterygium wilfordii]|uniref:Uncharacterized protein n=1 Tax=Tripterygium wilfordii TaxID=458696 RepID=A0A7J7CUA5_TRIWF|nr:hypothetical protein HS088_TW13G00591 [Tripterygium wilfordii]
MCCVSEGLKPISNLILSVIPKEESRHPSITMNHLTVETEDTFASLLELAANNDTEAFKRSIECNPSCVDEVGQWYGRLKGSSQMVNEHRTPLMVAAIYGSIDVMRLILSLSDADVNLSCGLDGSTALHCAASGGAVNAVDVVKLLLAAGADPNLVDANGHRPVDVIVVPPKLRDVKSTLEELLATDGFINDSKTRESISTSNSNSPPLSPSLKNGFLSSSMDLVRKLKMDDVPMAPASEKKEYPVDPSLPDIKNSIYSTDEFPEELRPLYVSTGSAVPSPRSLNSGAAAMDFAAAMSLLPGSPSSVSVMSPSPFTPPMSPSANGMPDSSVAWPQPNIPALHLPGSNLQSSRLRSSLNARDMLAEEFGMLPDYDVRQQHIINELSSLSQSSLSSSLNRSGRLKTLTPSNLDDLFSAEGSSPRYPDQALAAAVLNQFQQQQSMLSPINTNFSPKNVDHPLLQGSFGVPSSGRMSPRNVEPISPMASRVSMLVQREKQQQQFRSLSSRELGSTSAAIVGSPVNSWSKWGSSNGKPDWAVSTDELGRLRRSSSFELGNGEEPDLSWVQSLVKESPSDVKEKLALTNSADATFDSLSEDSSLNPQMEPADHAMVGALLEQMRIDQLVAQQN